MATEAELLDYLKWVTADLAETRRRVADLESGRPEPVAIVGMSCRYPGGVGTPDELWELVASGREGLSPLPEDRGWEAMGLLVPELLGDARPQGGFVADAAGFDAAFFGISPREATAMDPQQRLLLEAAWEAVERAGVDPAALRGEPVGVFVGASAPDYTALTGANPEAMEGYVSTGMSGSVLSGRLAYVLGLTGPAITVDTACSSSLVALHLAANALRTGECSLALAGGVVVMASPVAFNEFTRQDGLAGDGRCKSYAAAADGTGWGEGVGVLVVERLSDARANGHRVLAVVRGSAVNQDGASNGLTAPNGPSQERVILQALTNAGLTPAEVDVVEGHGTGTRLGDPIEARALLATYGTHRTEPLWLGSLKSNIGHTQAAAGVAGIIKMVQAMRHATMPATLHVDAPSPHVDWAAGRVELLTEARPWPRDPDRPRRAGVSSFGISGTNAHVILEEGDPAPESTVDSDGGPTAWIVSAKSERSLLAQAARLADWAERSDVDPRDAAVALATRRSRFPYRAVVTGSDRSELVAGLREVSAGAAAADRPKTVMVFPGQGWQRAGLGAELLASSPVFAASVDECGAALAPWVDFDLRTVLAGDDWLGRVEVVQPVLWAVMVSLARVWESVGVVPDAVVGHSQGEIAAAVVAGALSLADGAKVVAVRARALRDLAGSGGMAWVGAPVERVEEWLVDGLCVAAVNGPESVVVSGPPGLLGEWVAGLAAQTRVLDVDYASHSSMVELVEAGLRERLADVRPRAARIGWLSTVTQRWLDGPEADGGYWYTNLREPVRFGPVVEALVAEGYTAFLEVSGHPVLTVGVSDVAPVVTGTLRRDEPEWVRVLAAAGVLHCAGVGVDWGALLGDARGAVELPTYAFEHSRYWLDPAGGGHPLLGPAVELAGGQGTVHTGRISLAAQPWLADHAVSGVVLFPGSAMVELAVRAADEAGCGTVRELTLHAPLAIPERGTLELQVTVAEPAADGTREVGVHARAGEDGEWTRHASGVLADDPGEPADPGPLAWPPAGAEPVDLDDFYDRAAAGGVDYGPAFQVLRAAWRTGSDVYAEVALPDGAAARPFGLHPALLDGAAQAIALSNLDTRGMPFAWTGVRLHATGADRLRVRVGKADDGGAVIAATDPESRPVISVESLVLRPAGEETRPGLTRGAMFQVDWVPVETGAEPAEPAEPWAVAGTGEEWRTAPVAAYHPPAGTTAEAARAAVAATLAVVQDRLADGGRLVVVTRGAVPAAGADVTNLAGAAVWGLVRSVQTEHPGLAVLVDTDDDGPLPAIAVAAATGDEPQLALRGGALYAARLARTAPPPAAAPAWRPDGTVLITGGTGALGAVVARHLAGVHGVRNLLLLSRSGPQAPGAGDLAGELSRLGANVRVVAADVADRAALAAVLASIPADRPLTAVVHAAGAVADGTAEALTADHLDRALRPKADGAWHLHELTEHLPLAAFVLFSSTSGVLGAAGMAGYSAANAYLDALAHHRRGLDRPAASLAWGTWAEESGMGGRLAETDRRRLARTAAPLSSPQALALLDAALELPDPAPILVNLDLAALRAQLGADPAPPLFRRLLPPRRAGRAARGAAATWAERLAAVPPAELPAALLDLVREQAAKILGHANADAVPAERTFSELGFDSLTAVELRNVLSAATGLRLPAALVFDHPNPELLVAHLMSKLDGAAPGAAEPPATEAANPVAALYVQACEAGKYDEAWEFARAVGRLAPSFDGPGDLPVRPEPVTLSGGPAGPWLFCFPSFSPASGVHEYTRFAVPFRDGRPVLVVPEPGFVAGQSLPSTFDALLRLHADTVLRAAGGAPFALLGRSASGWLAYSLAHHLESIGQPPAAVVLLDTYFGEQQDRANLYRGARAMMAREQRSTMLSDVRVTAMGRYEALIARWHPEPVQTPTLLVRATTPFSDEIVEGTGGDWQASMSFTHDTTDVPGDHFSMLEDFAGDTAAAVDAWLRRIAGDDPLETFRA